MVPVAYLEHELAGRIRLRVPSKRGDGSFFEAARQGLSGAAAVEAVSANPDTGSVLIRFSGDLGSLEAEAARRGIFSLDRGKPAKVPSTILTRANAAAAAGPVNPTTLGLSGLGLYQITRGRALGSASEIFWNAYAAYRILGNPALALLLGGLGVWQMLRGEWLGPASALMFYALMARRLSTEDAAVLAPGPE